MDKKELRAWAGEKIKDFSDKYLLTSNNGITAQLLQLPLIKNAQTIFCYVSVGKEPSTHAFLQAQLEAGKTICVPKTYKGGNMEARQILSLQELAPAQFGLLEPDENTPIISAAALDVIVVPCLMCDQSGTRLGYGGGYYDRYLTNTSCPTVCLCRQKLFLPQLPKDAFDIAVNCAVTDNSVFYF
ncbi:MAG: 5-formyltetrahydrofolate cyclo-ligase [Oscillospiraceae bacterium]